MLKALRTQLSDAALAATALRIAGNGTWLHAGRPVESASCLSLRDYHGVIEYVPGDLVITVRAGTTLGEIAHATAEHNQWLTLDPYGNADALNDITIGATVATASPGPLAHGFGRVRDLVLGLSFLTGNGTPVRAGGRVVKNVAGFDLVRLTAGAWGTLGVITEVTLRLQARPAVDRTFAIAFACDDDPRAREQCVAHVVEQLNSTPLRAVTSTLSSLVLLSHDAPGAVSNASGVSSAPFVLLARAMGNATRVEAQRVALSTLGPIVDASDDVWRLVRSLDDRTLAFNLSGAPMNTSATWHRADAWLASHRAQANVVTDPYRGTVRVMSASSALANHLFDLPASAIAEHLPVGVWESQRVHIHDPISTQLRRVFDPANILNRGILGDAMREEVSANDALADTVVSRVTSA